MMRYLSIMEWKTRQTGIMYAGKQYGNGSNGGMERLRAWKRTQPEGTCFFPYTGAMGNQTGKTNAEGVRPQSVTQSVHNSVNFRASAAAADSDALIGLHLVLTDSFLGGGT